MDSNILDLKQFQTDCLKVFIDGATVIDCGSKFQSLGAEHEKGHHRAQYLI